MIRGVDHYVAKLHEWLQEAFKEAQVQSTSEAERQKWYYDRIANAISLEPGDLVLAKTWCLQGKEESEALVVGGTIWNGVPGCWRCPFLPHEEPVDRMLTSPLQNGLFLIAPTEGTPLCMVLWAKGGRCTSTTLEEQSLEGSETEEVPQSANCLTGPASDRWD